MKKQLNLIGAAGEYFVCAELCKLGYLALLTPKNNPIFDVLTSDIDGRNTVSIQVKTRSIDNTQGWKMGKDICIPKGNENSFVVLVNLLEDEQPEFYVYEYDILAKKVSDVYDAYINVPKKDGTRKKEVGFRWFDKVSFAEDDKKRKNNWQPIVEKLTR